VVLPCFFTFLLYPLNIRSHFSNAHISERLEIESELKNENLQPRKQNQLMSEIVTAALEEVRAALGALKDIICNAEPESLDEISPELKEDLELAENSIERATRTISHLYNTSGAGGAKMQAGAD